MGQEAILAIVWNRGGRVFTCTMGEVTRSDAVDSLRRTVRDMGATLQRLDTYLRLATLRARRKAKLSRQEHPGGAPSFGYRVQNGRLVAEPTEQAVLLRILELRRGGASLRRIARTLDDEGHLPKRSSSWHPEGIRRIIARMEEKQLPLL
jgi:hypothetical protein